MKKKNLLFLAAGGALFALTSCSSDDAIATNQSVEEANTISFRPLMNNVTRAADIDAGTGTYGLKTLGFTVFATLEGGSPTEYFAETPYTWDGTSSSYTSSTKRYWPSEGTLEFFAYANSKPTSHESQVVHTAGTKVFTVTPDAEAQYQTDLVVACTTGKQKTGTYGVSSKYGVDGVPLNFRHAMTKVTIQLKNSSTDLHFEVGNVILGNVFESGTYTFTKSTDNGGTPTTKTNTDDTSGFWLDYDDWGSRGASTSYTQAASTTTYAVGAAASPLANSMILIPQQLTNAAVYSGTTAHDYTTMPETPGSLFNASNIQVQIKVFDSSNHYLAGTSSAFVTALWPLPATKWLPGYHYTYTVDLAGGGYYPDNQDSDTDLDPILEGAEIKFVSVTVDAWNTTPGETNVTMP